MSKRIYAPMSEENKLALSARQKEIWAKRKAEQAAKDVPPDPLQQAQARVPFVSDGPIPSIPPLIESPTAVPIHNSISIHIDWDHTPMPEAQQFYAHLQSEYNKAGRILNARSMTRLSGYTCFMCHKHFSGNPGFTDLSFISPDTGLMIRVDCCGELCVINYHKLRIDMRTAKNIAQAVLEREA